MNNLDFRVEDKVKCLLFGSGIVSNIDKNNIIVVFEPEEDEFTDTSIIVTYNKNGIILSIKTYDEDDEEEYTFKMALRSNRSLYHTGTRVSIKEIEPDRPQWRNIFICNGSHIKEGKNLYDTEKEATDDGSLFRSYIASVKLIKHIN